MRQPGGGKGVSALPGCGRGGRSLREEAVEEVSGVLHFGYGWRDVGVRDEVGFLVRVLEAVREDDALSEETTCVELGLELCIGFESIRSVDEREEETSERRQYV